MAEERTPKPLFGYIPRMFITRIGDFLCLPQSKLEEIKRNYQSNTKRKEAYLDTYAHVHPCPSWKKISEVLLECGLDQQAEEVNNVYVQGRDG